MKIYLMIAGAFLGLLIFSFKIYAENASLKDKNAVILQANRDLNESLSAVIKQNALEKELLQQKFEVDLQNAKKIEKVKSYVKNSTESNVSKLFNDTILRLQ